MAPHSREGVQWRRGGRRRVGGLPRGRAPRGRRQGRYLRPRRPIPRRRSLPRSPTLHTTSHHMLRCCTGRQTPRNHKVTQQNCRNSGWLLAAVTCVAGRRVARWQRRVVTGRGAGTGRSTSAVPNLDSRRFGGALPCRAADDTLWNTGTGLGLGRAGRGGGTASTPRPALPLTPAPPSRPECTSAACRVALQPSTPCQAAPAGLPECSDVAEIEGRVGRGSTTGRVHKLKAVGRGGRGGAPGPTAHGACSGCGGG